MTYSLNTLNASSGSRAAPRSGAARFGHEIGLVLGLVAWVFWLLALLSYSAQDAAWSTSGAGQARMVSNWVGRLGAWLADSSYFMLGFSVWWAVVAFVWAWLSALARWMRGGEVPEGAPSPLLRRLLFWGGAICVAGAAILFAIGAEHANALHHQLLKLSPFLPFIVAPLGLAGVRDVLRLRRGPVRGNVWLPADAVRLGRVAQRQLSAGQLA